MNFKLLLRSQSGFYTMLQISIGNKISLEITLIKEIPISLYLLKDHFIESHLNKSLNTTMPNLQESPCVNISPNEHNHKRAVCFSEESLKRDALHLIEMFSSLFRLINQAQFKRGLTAFMCFHKHLYGGAN